MATRAHIRTLLTHTVLFTGSRTPMTSMTWIDWPHTNHDFHASYGPFDSLHIAHLDERSSAAIWAERSIRSVWLTLLDQIRTAFLSCALKTIMSKSWKSRC